MKFQTGIKILGRGNKGRQEARTCLGHWDVSVGINTYTGMPMRMCPPDKMHYVKNSDVALLLYKQQYSH